MATEPENPRLAGRHLQVLRVLTDAPHGCDVNALLTRGVKLETMADLIQGELATVQVETVEERGSKIEVACVRITYAGGGHSKSHGRQKQNKVLRRPERRRFNRRWLAKCGAAQTGLALPRFFARHLKGQGSACPGAAVLLRHSG
jgi:hypothetical protein